MVPQSSTDSNVSVSSERHRAAMFLYAERFMSENKREHDSNLSARPPDCPVTVLPVPADTCPEQQSTAPPAPAQHHDSPQNRCRDLRIPTVLKTHDRSSGAPTPLNTDWMDPPPPPRSARAYLLYQLSQQREEQH